METLTPELYDVMVRIVGDKVKGIKVTRGSHNSGVQSRIHVSDVERFNELLSGARDSVGGTEVIGVLFGYVIYPDAKERAQKLGIHVVASCER
ncbi:hypothetical protein [Conexivisphaera calida]|uniref:Uncharacterized protein n=1 Tax=Conexivisphaera calida TaxID=1874277 RepID=A0A4P2VLF5_9ARCH|nr:hypothetical protein [Conexivisphaera calida]BBE41995.1 hypothetical protein NAS2_0606 [Conexivisphaera calida]